MRRFTTARSLATQSHVTVLLQASLIQRALRTLKSTALQFLCLCALDVTNFYANRRETSVCLPFGQSHVEMVRARGERAVSLSAACKAALVMVYCKNDE